MTNHDIDTQIRGGEFTPRFDISPEERSTLTLELLSRIEKPEEYPGRYICFEVEGEDPATNIARSIELEVFDAKFGNDLEVMKSEYGEYDANSRFLLVVDKDEKEPAGVMRVIENSDKGLKTLNDIQKEPFNLSIDDFVKEYKVESFDKCWDIGTLAILPKYRGMLPKSNMVSIIIYRAVYLAALREGIEHFVTIADDAVYKKTQALGMPYEPILDSGPHSYLDSKSSYALYGHVPDFYSKMRPKLDRLEKSRKIRDRILAPYVGQLVLGTGIDQLINKVS